MIPKIIHYCWLSGDPLPSDIKKYMRTWKEKLPDYELMLWDTERFNVNSSLWVKQAFENKKYAFAADYIRVYALYHYGGIYLDTDIEVLKSYNAFLHLNVMLGLDHTSNNCEVATWGAEKGAGYLKKILDFYDRSSFVKEDGNFELAPMPGVVLGILKENGYKLVPVNSLKEAEGVQGDKCIPVFPREWFCPLDWYTFKLHLTKNTYSIHRYKGGWLAENVRKEREILNKLGPYLPRVWRKVQAWFVKLKS